MFKLQLDVGLTKVSTGLKRCYTSLGLLRSSILLLIILPSLTELRARELVIHLVVRDLL